MASPSRGRTQLFCFVFFPTRGTVFTPCDTDTWIRPPSVVRCLHRERAEWVGTRRRSHSIRPQRNNVANFFFFFLFCPTLSFPFLFYFSFSSLIDFSLERRWLLFFCLMMARPRWRACSLFRLTSSLLVFYFFFILFVLELWRRLLHQRAATADRDPQKRKTQIKIRKRIKKRLFFFTSVGGNGSTSFDVVHCRPDRKTHTNIREKKGEGEIEGGIYWMLWVVVSAWVVSTERSPYRSERAAVRSWKKKRRERVTGVYGRLCKGHIDFIGPSN